MKNNNNATHMMPKVVNTQDENKTFKEVLPQRICTLLLISILFSQHYFSFVFSTLFIINQRICLHRRVFRPPLDKHDRYLPCQILINTDLSYLYRSRKRDIIAILSGNGIQDKCN